MNLVLNEIVETKYAEVEKRKELIPVKMLEQSVYFKAPCVSLREYLLRPELVGIIAEIKRASPSVGIINEFISVAKLSIGYMQAGASALSVLTDSKFFKGSLDDLKVARQNNYCPILRKDFIVDEYQILEARSSGADVILLIAKILTLNKCKELARFAHSLGMEVLLEVHDDRELEEFATIETKLLGINSRNLDSLEMSQNFLNEAIAKIPSDYVAIAESGIKTSSDVINLKSLGYKGFLIGHAFMQTADPAFACRQFIKSIQISKTQ